MVYVYGQTHLLLSETVYERKQFLKEIHFGKFQTQTS